MVDPRIEQALSEAEDAHARLVDSLVGVDDSWCRAPSLLPGWSRGHVLTHVARNADALERLATGTAEGRTVAMYGPGAAREADIEAGAGRSAAKLVDDVRTSAERLHGTCRALPAQTWDAVPEWRNGRRQPLTDIAPARVVEAEVHRVDLGAGYTPNEWA
ncbi:MAG: maleylpyruvate isomerase N-terminal domain-containing protein [Nocardioidaceae bacterium]|nr:maleylpyruvate isomerase N-terminal domain-containing protein [Nocardioidaceae bacterium]